MATRKSTAAKRQTKARAKRVRVEAEPKKEADPTPRRRSKAPSGSPQVPPLTDGDNGADRTRDGRFARGNRGGRGNPKWQALAAMRRQVVAAESPDHVRSVLVQLRLIALGQSQGAKVADQIAAARVYLERVLGRPQTPAAPLDLPDVKSAADLPAAFSAVLSATRRGDLSVEQMREQVALLEAHRVAFGDAALEARIDGIQAQLEAFRANGQPAGDS